MQIDIDELNLIHVATCVRCGEPTLKRVMIAVSARRGSHGSFKTLCYFCRECWATSLRTLRWQSRRIGERSGYERIPRALLLKFLL